MTVSSVVTFKPVPLATWGGEENGRLVFAGDYLMAVIAQDPDRDHASDTAGAGRWLVKAGFGPCAEAPPEGFATLQDVSVWIASLLDGGEAISVIRARFPLS